jgi:hypothetical protein
MKASLRHSFFAAVGLAGALFSTACQSQSVGEHCDKLNGDADCESGLICGDSFVCCVPGTAACNAATSTGTSGGSGAAGAPGSDAATDSSVSEAATSDSATNDSTKSEATSSEAMSSSDTGPEAGPATPDAADGAD